MSRIALYCIGSPAGQREDSFTHFGVGLRPLRSPDEAPGDKADADDAHEREAVQVHGAYAPKAEEKRSLNQDDEPENS